MTHNSSVNFKLINFLLWMKWSYQSLNSEVFQVLWWIFAIFFMSFSKPQVNFSWNLSSFFRVMKDNSSGFFSVKRYMLCTKGTNQSKMFENLECSGQNSPNSCHFWNNKSVFLRNLHQSSVSWDINPLYFFMWKFVYFQQKEPIKVHIWWNFMWAVQSLIFCTLMGSFYPNHIKFLLKKVQKSYISWHWRVIQSLKKNGLVVSNMTWRIWWILMRAVASLKICPLMCYFCQKHIISEPKNYRGVLCHNTKKWCKLWGGTDLCFEKWHEEFGKSWLDTRKSQNLHFNGLLLSKVYNI